MNVSLFIRKSHPTDDEMIGAVQQRDGQYIIPVNDAHTLDASTAEHLRRHGGFVSVRKTELQPYVGRRMQNVRTEAGSDAITDNPVHLLRGVDRTFFTHAVMRAPAPPFDFNQMRWFWASSCPVREFLYAMHAIVLQYRTRMPVVSSGIDRLLMDVRF